MIESLVHDTFLQSSYEDPLEACLNLFGCNLDTKKSIEDVNALLEYVPLLSIDSLAAKSGPFSTFFIPIPIYWRITKVG